MLNEFLPEDKAKRQHSGKLDVNRTSQALEAQLCKAERTLLQVQNNYQQFPNAI